MGKGPGRVRLAVIASYSAASPSGLVAAAIASGSTVVGDGWSGYAALKDVRHDPKVVGPMAAHPVLPRIHRVFANARRWGLGVYRGLRPKHLQADPGLGPAQPDPGLDELVFRFNRRRTPAAAFGRLPGLAATLQPASCQMSISRS